MTSLSRERREDLAMALDQCVPPLNLNDAVAAITPLIVEWIDKAANQFRDEVEELARLYEAHARSSQFGRTYRNVAADLRAALEEPTP